MSKIFFSIVVPVYNVEQYIDRCISSLIDQDIDDYEIILIDDASVDNSVKKIKDWEQKCEKIFLIIKNENTGLSDTRNLGIKKAQGRYVLFIDSDDYIDRNVLKHLKDELEIYDPDILYFGYWVEQINKIERIYNYKSQRGHIYAGKEFIKNELIKRNLPIPACAACYKVEYLKKNNLFFKKGILHEDVRWSPITLYLSEKVYASDLAFYHYVLRDNSISQKKHRTKNGIDLLETCHYLKKFSKKIESKIIKKYFLNYIAMTYMKAVAVNGLAYESSIKVERTFPLKHTCFYKDFVKAIFFLFSPLLYTKIYMYIKINLKKDVL